MATWSGPWLVAIVAAASTIVALVVFLRFWQPKRRILNVNLEDITGHAARITATCLRTIFNAWLPWLVLSVTVFLWGLPRISAWMDAHSSIKIPVAGLHNAVQRVPPVVAAATKEAAIFNFNWLTATGTGILFAALIAGLLMGLGPRSLAAAFMRTVFKIRYTFVTIAAMMAIGYITRYCGLDATLGLAFARTGALYPFFGTLIGWLGTASTGSDTSSNVLFGSLQVITARQIGVSPVLMASANSAGGVMGKMIDAASIVVASTHPYLWPGGSILRFVFFHSLALAALAGIAVTLLAYVPLFVNLVAR
jgi:lactate permease